MDETTNVYRIMYVPSGMQVFVTARTEREAMLTLVKRYGWSVTDQKVTEAPSA